MYLPEGNILLTGATGFLGFRVLERLVENSFSGNIIAAGRVLKPRARLEAGNVHYRLGDLSDAFFTEQLFEEFPITHIINCAALSSPWGQYEAFFRANVLSQKHLIRLAEKHAVKRFVHISTPSLYFDYRNRLDIKESDPLPRKFVNHYAATKREAEILLEKSSLDWVALRPRALVGRGDTVIMPRVIRAYDEGKLRIIGNGENFVDITPVSNVVDAVVLSLTAPEKACGKQYNIANGAPVKLWAMLAGVLQRLDRHLPEKKVPLAIAMTAATLMETAAKWTPGHREPALTRYSVGTIGLSFSMDISLAQKYLGYSPQQSVKEAMDEFVEWYKNG
ncbi:MAG: NAD-dependent epimerase/dehydratase family protein [Bacteroidia bacterium]|nr:NAD-dependent epimerase/dehydratase family protein [Bacteroidia bacterium]